MKTNIGSVDRVVRIIVGLAALGVGYYYRSWWGLLGFIPLLTATVQLCPLYTLLGVSTKKAAKE